MKSVLTDAEKDRAKTNYIAAKKKLADLFRETLPGDLGKEFFKKALERDPVNYEEFMRLKSKLDTMDGDSYQDLSQACNRWAHLGSRLILKVAIGTRL